MMTTDHRFDLARIPDAVLGIHPDAIVVVVGCHSREKG
jgi:hypothetical protein